MEITADRLDEILSALGEHLQASGSPLELVVIGGSGLRALRLVRGGTKDVDVLAIKDGDMIRRADPLPTELDRARALVARDFGLDEDWLNGKPTSLLDFDLPDGFWKRVVTRQYGPALRIHFASRFDQIHFKLYAMVDDRIGSRHEADLRTLSPTRDELLAAARWAMTHDVSETFRELLLQALRHLGVEDADLGG
jgi:hypothetical protein